MGRASRPHGQAGSTVSPERGAVGAVSAEKFETGVAIGSVPELDQRDPRISGYKNPSVEEAYARLEEIKKAAPHRVTNGLDLTDFDHVHSLVLPEIREAQLREYVAAKTAERSAEVEASGVTRTSAYGLSRPTAKEAGAQYDIHADNIALGDSFEVAAGEKARLPGGEFVMGPVSIRVEEGNKITRDEEGRETRGMAVVVSAPLGQGIGSLSDPMDNDSLVPVTTAEDLRGEWVRSRATRIYNDCQNKRPVTYEEAEGVVRNNPIRFGLEEAEGYSGSDMKEEDYEQFVREASENIVRETRNDRALTREEAVRVAEREFEDTEPCHELRFNLDPATGHGSRDLIAPSGGYRGSLEITNSIRTVSPNPNYGGPSYLDWGVNPEVPSE